MKKTAFILTVCIFVCTLGAYAQMRPERQARLKTSGQTQKTRMTPEMEEQVLKYVQENFPRSIQRLARLKENNPEAYASRIEKTYREISYVEALKDTDKDRYNKIVEERKLNQQSIQLAEEYRETDNQEIKMDIKEKLEVLLNEIFENRQQNRKYEIERLEKKLMELKEANQKREKNKKLIVEKRLNELLGQNDELKW